MSTLQRAIEIATLAHQGQADKSGNDYIGHPLRVMEMGKTENERIVGVLHDRVKKNPLAVAVKNNDLTTTWTIKHTNTSII